MAAEAQPAMPAKVRVVPAAVAKGRVMRVLVVARVETSVLVVNVGSAGPAMVSLTALGVAAKEPSLATASKGRVHGQRGVEGARMPAPTCPSAIASAGCASSCATTAAAESSAAEAAEGLSAAFLVVLGLRGSRRLLRVEHPVGIVLSRRLDVSWWMAQACALPRTERRRVGSIPERRDGQRSSIGRETVDDQGWWHGRAGWSVA